MIAGSLYRDQPVTQCNPFPQPDPICSRDPYEDFKTLLDKWCEFYQNIDNSKMHPGAKHAIKQFMKFDLQNA